MKLDRVAMNALVLLKKMRDARQESIFSMRDIGNLVGGDFSSAKEVVNLLDNNGVVDKIGDRLVLNPFNEPGAEEVAMLLYSPSYLSLEYALGALGVLSQLAFTITTVWTGEPESYTPARSAVRFESNHIPKELFFGSTVNSKGVALALPEKALLDFIFVRHIDTGEFTEGNIRSFLDDMDLSLLDAERLHEFAAKFQSYGGRKMMELIMAAV